MAQLEQSYDANDLPKSDFEPVPAGNYDCSIHSAEVVNTKNNGQMLKFRLDITGPTHQGRVVFGNVTLRNANPKAVEIGKQQLGDLIRACGIPRLTDSDQIIGCQVLARIGIEKSEEYGDKNRVNRIQPPSGSSPMPHTSFGTSAPAPSGIPAGLKSSSSKPSWTEKKAE
jgi:hypothetical protein